MGRPPAWIGLCLAPALLPTDGEPFARGAELERALPRWAEQAGVPGVSVAVADSEGLVWHGFHGRPDAAGASAVDAETVFEAASLSKPVFAYVFLQLVTEGRFDLDTPLVEYAPLADLAHDPRHAELTARRVLGHTTGLPNWRPAGQPLEFAQDPGQSWIYSGEGFVLLQGVVESVVGESLESIARTLVFEPLEMRRTSYVWRPEFASNLARPHEADGSAREGRQMEEPNAAYSLLTTASDYARFLSALLRGDALSRELRRALLDPHTDVSPGVHWGLGIGLEENDDGLALWHWGHNSGYRAYTVAYPERDFALVYFANSDHGMRLLRPLVELATGEEDHPAVVHLGYESLELSATDSR